MSLTLMPAVDVTEGRVARVAPGAEDDPLAVALRWVGAGAPWLHLVDLDQAFRRGHNRDLLRDLIDAVPVPVQLSGGLDDQESVQAALETNADRVNLASTALLDVELVAGLVEAHRSRIVVGLDLRGEQVVARGSSVGLGGLRDLLPDLAATGATEFLVADASRDGSRRGVDLTMFTQVIPLLRLAIPDSRAVASGGVSGAADLVELSVLEPQGLWAVVLGASLHQGTFTVGDALAALSP